jgi:hypothetical protein
VTSSLSYKYQWNRNGLPIPGATSGSYMPDVTDVGEKLTCTVTVEGASGMASATSPPTTAVFGAPGFVSLPAAAVGVLYSYTFSDWESPPLELTSGFCPPGLVLAGATVSGTPTTSGPSQFGLALSLRQLWHEAVPSGTRNVYVSALTGSDTNTGLTPTSQYASINAALTAAEPGDRILVAAGTYGYTSAYGVNGTPTAWVSVESASDTVRPVISVADNSGHDGVDCQQSSYLGFFGLELEGLQTSSDPNPSGFAVFRGSKWIRLWNNVVHDFPGGGINCFYSTAATFDGSVLPAGGWDLVDVCFNTIYDSCKYSPYNTSGISFYGAVDMTGTTLDGTYGYRSIGNYIYNCICTVPYTPGGTADITDGNGISFDSLAFANSLNPGLAAYTKRGLAEGNIVVGCGGRGLHVYNTINVDDFFNTYVGNLRTTSPAITNGVETDAQYSTASGANGVLHFGNLICPLNTPNTTDGVSTYTSNVMLGGSQTVPSGNTDRRSAGVDYFSGSPSAASLLTGIAVSSFVPGATDAAPGQKGAAGAVVLGQGCRPVAIWAAGALEYPRTAVLVVNDYPAQ